MDRQIEAYVKTYNLVEPEVCEQTITELQNVQWRQHEFYNSHTRTSGPQSGDKELDVTMGPVSTSKHIESKVWEAYKNYVTGLNFPWFGGWKSFTDVRFNRYIEGRVMAMHCDHIHAIFDGERQGVPTMTALGALNDDYDGGELVMFEDTIIPMKKGDIVVFPSCFLYPHKVDPVIKGVRYSYVCWSW